MLLTIRKFLRQHTWLLMAGMALLVLSLLLEFFWTRSASPEQVKQQLEQEIARREADFESLVQRTDLLTRLTEQRAAQQDLAQLLQRDYFIFLARESADGPLVVSWNTQTIAPEETLWQEESPALRRLINGYYLVRTIRFSLTSGGTAQAMALIPLKWDYFLTTNYLNNNFAYLPGLEQYYSFSITTPTPVSVTDSKGRHLFWIGERSFGPAPLSATAIVLRLLGVLLLLIALHRLCSRLAQQHHFVTGFLFLAGMLVFFRSLSYVLPLPLNFRRFELFDPSVYGSNFILKSLGDLLINTLLFLWLLLFVYRHRPEDDSHFTVKRKWFTAAGAAVLLFAAVVLGGNVVRSLVADSQISFHVTDFFSLGFYSFTGFFILGCIMAILYLLLELLIYALQEATGHQLWLQLLLPLLAAFLYLTITLGQPQVQFQMALLFWLLLVIAVRYAEQRLPSLVPTGGRVVFWLFFFAVSLTALLMHENGKREWEDRKRMAEKLSVQSDPAAENLLSIALTNFRGDFLQEEFYRFRSTGPNRMLKDSLLGEHFSGYLNKYATRIFTYDAEEQPLFNDDSTSFSTLNTIYNIQARATTVKDWRFYDESFDKFYYIARREIRDPASGETQGYLFVLSKPGRYAGEKFIPELFNRQFYTQPSQSSAYSYAVYRKKQLINTYNDYPFPVQLPVQFTGSSGFYARSGGGYSQLWYVASGNRVVAVVRKNSLLLDAVTLFAYLFFTFLIMWALYRLTRMVLRSGLRLSFWRQQLQLSFRAQVHTTIIFISILSFLVIGVSTIFFFINRHNRSNKERLSRTIQIMRAEVEQALDQHSVFDDVLKVYEPVAAQNLQLRVNRISDIHGVDVNVYDPAGNLRVSSQPYYYNKGLLSRKMNPAAFFSLTRLRQAQVFENEQVGSQSYMSIYVPVRDVTGDTYAYVNIPYFTSQNELRQEISSFLVTLINLNAFIFLVAGLIAFLVTNRITASFTFISDRMKEVRLGRPNAAILWNRKDEIGELVQQYNKMVRQLEESANLLAKSEREGAWREMARQVAHEIKNPLTPMKLSIQHLQKAISSDSADTKMISRNVARTLVEQIDYLSAIASDFSNFANIANPRMEEVRLVDSIQSVTDLFAMDEQVQVIFSPGDPGVKVLADKTHLNRLFTNLIRNAIEAVPAGRTPRVELSYRLQGAQVVVEVKDNGSGIPAELREKIFYPNFTTKSSGTGLGLAMCKGIAEQMKGDLWFETVLESGTTFFLELPVIPVT